MCVCVCVCVVDFLVSSIIFFLSFCILSLPKLVQGFFVFLFFFFGVYYLLLSCILVMIVVGFEFVDSVLGGLYGALFDF